jgi:hypothetical protein
VQSPEFLYVPLTVDDERVRGTLRYRVGGWLRGKGIAVVLCAAAGLPLALVLDWSDDGDALHAREWAVVWVLWSLSLVGVYCWYAFQLQDVSERRRAYLLQGPTADDDLEIAAAKKVVFDSASTGSERDEAMTILRSGGACRPNTVSLVREYIGSSWLGRSSSACSRCSCGCCDSPALVRLRLAPLALVGARLASLSSTSGVRLSARTPNTWVRLKPEPSGEGHACAWPSRRLRQ